MEDLKVIIENLQIKHKEVSEGWSNSPEFKNINYNKKTVLYAHTNDEISNSINQYIKFLNDIELDLHSISKIKLNSSKLEYRIKKQNSVVLKFYNYLNKKEQGNIRINKVLNDLFGIRVILNNTYNYSQIKQYLEDNDWGKLKCIDSSKEGYLATHIYLNSGNLHFQWELQVWAKENEENNRESHKIYKQAYTNWELQF